MTLKDFDPQALMQSARQQMADEPGLSPALKTTIELLITLCLLLLERLPKSSRTSHLPPSQDPNRLKKSNSKDRRRPGAQPGRTGRTLKQVEKPDQIKFIKVDRHKLPPGPWRDSGRYARRQVFDVEIKTVVTEYRAQIMVKPDGQEFQADFPDGVLSPTQYGSSVKAMSVYLSQSQLLPYDRVSDLFADQMMLPLSPGSICHFNLEAAKMLEGFENWVSEKLAASPVLNLDETSINVGGQRVWLHLAANESYSRYYPHQKRGSEAINEMGILPNTSAILCHDHWKPYYLFVNEHALCNAHILRELAAVYEADKSQSWAKKFISLLNYFNRLVTAATGSALSEEQAQWQRRLYLKVLELGNQQCPEPPRPPGKKGRIKKSNARNLLERLDQYQDDVLRFMTHPLVPFTNNLAERNLRMIKVHQKISGCFRSWDGAKAFCRIRSYLSTCQKHNYSPTLALTLLFNAQLPTFVTSLQHTAE